jgi:hypothetical protein
VQDLLGDWTLVRCWGGLGSKRGGMRILAVASEGAGEELIEAIAKRRRQRGYVEHSGNTVEEGDPTPGVCVTATPERSPKASHRVDDLSQENEG